MKDNDATALPPGHWLAATDVPSAVWPIVAAAREGRDLKEAIAAAVRQLGFECFSFVRSPRDTGRPGAAFTSWGNIPVEWNALYRQRHYAEIDPRPRAAARSAIPEVWDRTRYPDTPELRGFFDAAASFGICSGVSMVMNQPDPGYIAFFSVVSAVQVIDGARRQAIARAMGDLWAIGAYGYRLLPGVGLSDDDARQAQRPLSARELECLTLAARGATSRAIADKLGISERTVNAHIERAIRKCGAKNRQEAVARAISDGVIPF
jgi:DNA-binding CsgD family transcriptional regulator